MKAINRIRQVLDNVQCYDLHHLANERHSHDEECPVVSMVERAWADILTERKKLKSEIERLKLLLKDSHRVAAREIDRLRGKGK